MKKKQILLSVFAALYSAVSLAQPGRKIDSLLIILKDQKEDTNRVNTLNGLSRNYYLMHNDSLSIRYAGDAIVLAEKLDFAKGCVRGYFNLGFNYQSLDNFSEAIKNFLAALKKAQEGNGKDLVAMAYNNLGWAHFNQSNPNEALKNFKISAEIFLQIGDKREAANSYYNIGNTYYSPLSNFTEAIKAQTISLKLSQEVGDKNKVAGRYIDLGNNYESLGNYPEAIKNYLAALKISEELGMKGNMGSAYNNIGEIYNDQGNYEEALKYYLAGLKLFEEVKSKRGITDSYSNIGGIYEKQGNFTEAMKYHLAALKLNQEMKWPYGMGYSYGDIGELYFAQSNYAEAQKNFLTSLNYFKQIEEIEGSAKTNVRIGETYFRMNNFPEARKYLNEALSAAQQFQGKKIIREIYEILSRVDSATGDWEQAYEDQKLFASYHDSLLNEENSKKIMENMVQYEFGKKEDSLKYQQVLTDEKLKQQTLLNREDQQSLLLKENELTLANKEKQLQQLRLQKNEADFAVQKAETEKKQNQLGLLNKEKAIQSLQIKRQKLLRNYLLFGLGIFIILSLIVYNNYRTRQKLKLQTLRNEIASDLHDDVGSTLSSISIFSQIAQQQAKEVVPLLETIRESSSKMLDAMADIVWTIKPENDQFEKIVLRMKNFAYDLLGAKKIDFEFIADEDVTKMKLSMDVRKNLYLIFKEATNNMVKYSGADKALFSIKGEKNNLTMLIQDNGNGFDTKLSTSGNGLKNMKKRAEEIGGQFIIDSKPGNGTTIELRIAV